MGEINMKKTVKLFAIASSFAFLANFANADQFIRMVSGPSGGSWYPLGAKIMQTFQSQIKGTATSNTSGGGISNVMSVDGGDAEFGFTYAHTVANGYNGKVNSRKQEKMFAILQHCILLLFKLLLEPTQK